MIYATEINTGTIEVIDGIECYINVDHGPTLSKVCLYCPKPLTPINNDWSYRAVHKSCIEKNYPDQFKQCDKLVKQNKCPVIMTKRKFYR